MSKETIKLPLISYSNYQTIINALKFYQYSSVEFVIDTISTTNISEIIDFMEQCHKVAIKKEKNKIEIPKMTLLQFELILKALNYYALSHLQICKNSVDNAIDVVVFFRTLTELSEL